MTSWIAERRAHYAAERQALRFIMALFRGVAK